MASKAIIAKYLALFHELYPTREISDLTLDAWEYACADMTDPGFGWAADAILKEPGRTYFPTPNELKAHLPAGGIGPWKHVRSGEDEYEQHWTPDAIAERNRQLREANGKLNAEYARKFPQVWREGAFAP